MTSSAVTHRPEAQPGGAGIDQGAATAVSNAIEPIARRGAPSFPIRVRAGAGATDHTVTVNDADATMAHVLDALALPAHCSVDGVELADPAATSALSVLAPGSLIEIDGDLGGGARPGPGLGAGGLAEGGETEPGVSGDEPELEIAVVAGSDAGTIMRAAPGAYELHTVAPPGAVAPGWLLQVDDVDPASAAPGPWHRQAASIEAVAAPGIAVAFGAPIIVEAGRGGPIHRPPRAVGPPAVESVIALDPPDPVRPPSPLSWATLLAPVPIALMMAVFFRPIFALFAAMGPVMALGRWYESRRRHRREDAERSRRVAEMRDAVRVAVTDQAERLAQHRWLANPHVPELWRRSRHGSVRLWERRSGSHDFLRFTVGIGPDLVDPIVSGGARHHELYADLLGPRALRPVPHVVDLGATSGIGLHGDRSSAMAVARAVLLQIATLHGPSDVTIGVLCRPDRVVDWDWIKWLPHLDRSITATASSRIVDGLGSAAPGASVVIIVVDDPAADVASVVRVGEQAGVQVRVVAVAPEATALPAACEVLLSVGPTHGELTGGPWGVARPVGTPVGISASTARSWARTFAGCHDPEAGQAALDRSRDVRLGDLVAVGSADELSARWLAAAAGSAAPVIVGTCTDGRPLCLDLEADGPHVLIAGTTGSGKSELLRTMAMSLALACPPERLHLALIDFKGGGAFDAVANLPHVGGVITDLDEQMVARALRSLRAELLRRESLFRCYGVSSFADAVAAVDADGEAQATLARLVVMIDEFAALATGYPDLMAGVVDLAMRGRSLGMHLVLATQRPSGVVDQKIRANTNLKIALRVQDTFDSQDVIGTSDAATIDRRRPGRAYVRVGGDLPILVQTAFTAATDRSDQRCSVAPFQLIEHPAVDPTIPGTAGAGVAGAGAAGAAGGVVSAAGGGVDAVDAGGGVVSAAGGGVDAVDAGGGGHAAGRGTPRRSRTELERLVALVAEVGGGRAGAVGPLWSAPLPLTLDWIDLGCRQLALADPSAGSGGEPSTASPGDAPDPDATEPGEGGRLGPSVVDAAAADSAGSVESHVVARGVDPRGVAIGLVDLPDEQRHAPWRWNPAAGALVAYAASAACSAKLLVSIGAAFASSSSADALHLYAIDGGSGGLAPLAALGHTGACLGADEIDRIDRVVARFEDEAARRRGDRLAPASTLVLLIDNLAGVLAGHEELAAARLVDRIAAIARDGAGLGLHLAVTGRAVRDVPHRLAQQIPNRLVMALADPSGYLAMGLRARGLPALPPMRAIEVAGERLVQLVEPPDPAGWCDAVARMAGGPLGVRGFPSTVDLADLPGAELCDGALLLPVGIEAEHLQPAILRLGPNEHALVIGPPGSGRSTALAAIGRQIRHAELGVRVVAVVPTASAQTEREPDAIPALGGSEGVAAIAEDGRPTVVLVDDAGRVDGGLAKSLEELLGCVHVRVVAATTPEAGRSVRAWTASIRSARTGIVLGGSPADADILGARVDRPRAGEDHPGRGHLVHRGRAQRVQLASANAPTDAIWLL